jgi:hypothetical protein
MIHKAQVEQEARLERYVLTHNKEEQRIQLFDKLVNRFILSSTLYNPEKTLKYIYTNYGEKNILKTFDKVDAIPKPVIEKKITIKVRNWTLTKENKVKEIHRLLDKYQEQLTVKLTHEGTKLIFDLIGEGSAEGTNRIIWDDDACFYFYYHKSKANKPAKLEKKTKFLEDIFKPKA